ncbi:amine dehydrogenase [Acetobacter sacchari]|uniref:Amine dehydrogenase n=1 Tax=Acetobacter sacchari TaxID=2661687 RepID=A0ABS3LQS8_9PROT|nr:amine dehydrogenase large subunit [Acetobacter sacchari]MBO1358269.1 amine dehydrogenase [Acetobacter sacchari]
MRDRRRDVPRKAASALFFRLLAPRLVFATCLGAALLSSTTHARAEEPVLQTEQSDIAKLPPAGPHRILVMDADYPHAKDGRVYVVDADAGKLLGMVQAAYNGNMVQAPDGRFFSVAETVWSRGNRGDRADLLATYDPSTLTISNDEVLPGRALVTPKANDLAISADGGRIYVYDMIPSNAVHVVSTATHMVETNVDIPGCALIYPWGPAGFSSLCADGGLSNVSLSAGGAPKVTHTPSFFAPDRDPVFENSPSVATDGSALFIAYSGLVYPAKLGANSTIGTPFSIQEAAGMKRASDASAPFETTWRPGGWQLAAYHKATGHLYVLMHKGTFWTHKEPGTEVWEIDVAARKLVRRISLPAPSAMIGVTQDASPLLFTTNDTGDFFILDAATGKLRRKMDRLGTSLVFTLAPGQ